VESKHVVAVAGIAGATVLGAVNLLTKGPDATVTTALVSAITFIAGLAFGYVKKPSK